GSLPAASEGTSDLVPHMRAGPYMSQDANVSEKAPRLARSDYRPPPDHEPALDSRLCGAAGQCANTGLAMAGNDRMQAEIREFGARKAPRCWLLSPYVDTGGHELGLLALDANAGCTPADNHIVEGTRLVQDREFRFRGVEDPASDGTCADDDH